MQYWWHTSVYVIHFYEIYCIQFNKKNKMDYYFQLFLQKKTMKET